MQVLFVMAKKSPAKSAPPALAANAAPVFYRGEAYDIEESVGHLVRVLIGSMTRSIDARMQPYDLTAMQWKPLLMLKLGRCNTAAELARQNCSDNGAMTRMLDRLEAKGLLRRVRSKDDRRVVRLELTAEGERVGELIPHALSAVLNEHLAGFDQVEFHQLKSLLRRMIANGPLTAGDTVPDPGSSP
jgi:DNA-binding MarR family transcriptional regulator